MAEQGDLFGPGVAETFAGIVSIPVNGSVALRRRVATHGLDTLDEADLLQLLLARRLPPGEDAQTTAETLMRRFGGIARILGAPLTDLARSVGPETAGELALLHAVLLRVLEQPLRQRPVLSSWDAVKAYLRARLSASPREAFHVLFLDKRNQLIADECMGRGSVDHAPVYPREVVRRALELSASALLLAHNHPSGDPTPSRADIDMTKAVVEAARALDIAVYDHVIVGGDKVVTLRALGLM